MQKELELVVHYPSTAGYYRCRGFKGLRLPAAAMIVFEGNDDGDQYAAARMAVAFCDELLAHTGALEEQQMPCSFGGSPCHAMNEPTCRKLLVLCIGQQAGAAFGWPTRFAQHAWLQHRQDPQWTVMTAIPAGSPIGALDPAWQTINAGSWSVDIGEQVPAVLQAIGLSPSSNRLFISYVRNDSAAIAEQLFSALTEAGFDVFLDRWSVPVGAAFQERLKQDLCDKSMVIFINSVDVPNSYWVQQEIALIKTYRLGLLELRLPGASPRPDIDQEQVEVVAPSALTPSDDSYRVGSKSLTDAALAALVGVIKVVHGRALHRRRYQLIDNFAAAIAASSSSASALADGSFLFSATATRGEVVVGLTARPPDLPDFSSLHRRGNVGGQRAGYLVSPTPFFIADRHAAMTWLGSISNITHIEEAQIAALVSKLG